LKCPILNLQGCKPKTRDELDEAIKMYCSNKSEGINKFGIIGTWNVSNITDMSELFYNKSQFNYDISNWDVSNVTNMCHMFCGCKNFNQPLNDWNVSNITNMHHMFCFCKSFNQPLNNWNVSNVSNVTNMNNMFYSCESFNQPLVMWNKVPHLSYNNYGQFISVINDLINNPHTTKQKTIIINNIVNLNTINNIVNLTPFNNNELMMPKYKNIFDGYKMPYKVTNYNIICVLEHFGININDLIDYDRFSDELIIDMYTNKRLTISSKLIGYIKKTDIIRYKSLEKKLKEIYINKYNKEGDVIIKNDCILISYK